MSSLLDLPPAPPNAVFALAHGAGAGMAHPFMAGVARGLAQRGVATLRYQFPFAERRSRRPDAPAVAHACVRAAVAHAAALLPEVPLFAGGKSFGGRMTSQAQAAAPLDGVAGLVFLGFPLHPDGKPGVERAAHLADVHLPMLFIQGTRDALATSALIEPVVTSLEPRATLSWIDGADHAFHVPRSSGRSDAQVLASMLDDVVSWMRSVTGAG